MPLLKGEAWGASPQSCATKETCTLRVKTPARLGEAVMLPTPEQSVRDAIEVMTAWAAQPHGPPDLLIACLRRHLDTLPPVQALAAATALIMGLTSLCGAVLALNEAATGIDMEDTLRELALRYAED